ncbi:MAG: methyltransferase domain-containing protein [Nocardioidaceae bacterium]
MRESRSSQGDRGFFFDDYPLFYETSDTAATARRLDLRQRAMIGANREILQGARVLDLASHDGRWSFAALKAGAEHVVGVEARAELVGNARRTFAEYGVPDDRYEFVRGDLFRVLHRRDFEVDVVFCLGFMYHTLRYPDLLRGIMDAGPRHCVIDTKVMLGDEPLVHLLVDRAGVQSNGSRDRVSNGPKVLAGWPSLPALRLLLDAYDFDVEDEFDWAGLLAVNPEARPALRDYDTGNRVTLRCRSRRTRPARALDNHARDGTRIPVTV